MIENGFPESQICVVPNMCKKRLRANTDETTIKLKYVAYIGRISKEKGVDLILQAAKLLPDIKFRLAGSGGEQYYQQVNSILNAVDTLNENISDAPTRIGGTLKMTAPLSFGLMHLNDVIDEYANQHPNLKFELDFSDRHVDLI